MPASQPEERRERDKIAHRGPCYWTKYGELLCLTLAFVPLEYTIYRKTCYFVLRTNAGRERQSQSPQYQWLQLQLQDRQLLQGEALVKHTLRNEGPELQSPLQLVRL